MRWGITSLPTGRCSEYSNVRVASPDENSSFNSRFDTVSKNRRMVDPFGVFRTITLTDRPATDAFPPLISFDFSFFDSSQREFRKAASVWKSTLAAPVNVRSPARESRVQPDFPL